MAGINIDSIMKKVSAYTKSSEGKGKMDERIVEIRKGKNGKTEGDGYVVTFEDMHRAAREMEDEARTVAQSHRLPDSVLDHFDSLEHTEPYYQKETGRYRVDISFGDNLYRPSLMIVNGRRKGSRTGDGIDNIVSLFDTGYEAGSRVWGEWSGHEELGVIGSRTSRDGIGFMDEAIDDFNRKHVHTKVHVVAILPDSGTDTQFYLR